MVRNNPYASKAVAVITANVVGTGIKPSIQDSRTRGLKNTKQAWKAWADTTACDWEGRKTFAGIQRLVMRSVAESGECFVRQRRVSGGPVPLKLQVLEADFLDTNKDGISTPNGGYIMLGIEFDAQGQRVAYWMFDHHPGENRLYRSLTSQRIPADEILHIFHEERPGQIRGVPFGVSAALRLSDFDEYEDAQLMRQKVAACFAAFVTDTKDPLPGEANPNGGYPMERVEPGMIEYLPPGKQVTFGSPPPTEGYDDYSRRTLQGIAAGYGVTYEALTGDLSNVNFSSGRMGWIEMGRQIAEWQELMLIPQLCDSVWQWFVTAGSIAGVASNTATASWTPPARMMIDPVKETKGLSDQVRNGFISWQEAVRQMGYDPDMIAEELSQDYKAFEALGFMLACDPRFDPQRQSPDDNANSPPDTDGAE
jgi:lambda family phage portal protein